MIWSQVAREMLKVLFFPSWINSTMYIISCVRIVLSSHKTQIMVLVIHFLEHRHPHVCWQVYKDAVAAVVLGAARWPALISCSPERWSPGGSGYCPLSLPDAGLVFRENLFQYSLPLPKDPVLVQRIVSRHLKLPKNENKHTNKHGDPFTDFNVMNR